MGADGLTMGREWPIASDLAALDPAQRERRRVLGAQLAAVAELPDGNAFRFPADSSTRLAVAEFVTLERRWWTFFDFVLEVEREGGLPWLHLTGRDGVKQFREASGMVKGRPA